MGLIQYRGSHRKWAEIKRPLRERPKMLDSRLFNIRLNARNLSSIFGEGQRQQWGGGGRTPRYPPGSAHGVSGSPFKSGVWTQLSNFFAALEAAPASRHFHTLSSISPRVRAVPSFSRFPFSTLHQQQILIARFLTRNDI